ncbi:hypothetical protein CI102_2949 [Trichoderma harzianum]|uniref:Transcription factor domain-containing protein n=1 Tax=Trichoderma harzianum CBS 226.95 TaxID=983964 RepID=A0A2T3ZXD5_TRIHA|nr:hypothetical protein M431DRAFT_126235 [Trichoderma harzianum CBS 226.95]PKK51044.1 hypothetical protein CI102_2949 [Trichoderma harzianum]PTB49438.1 hypothetical protein M431DRAFT_126235 [Trichoderma harzianum CBS 226.95]
MPIRKLRKDSNRSGAKEFEFIVLSGDETGRDRETQRRVRSVAQANYRRQHPYGRRRTTVELDVTPLLDGTIQSPNALPSQVVPRPMTILDASRSDPFQSFGFGDNLYDGTCPKFNTLVQIGFVDLARETIALSQMLSASAWHLVHWLGCESDSGEDAQYAMISTQNLQQRLNSVATGASDEVVIAVLTSAAYAVGVEALCLIEINGRFRQDAAPQFPPPNDILSGQSKLNLALFDAAQLSSGCVIPTVERCEVANYLCQQLRHLNDIIASETLTRDLWIDPLFRVFHISPVLHYFLSLPRSSIHDEINARQRECFRLAGILYLGNLRSKFDFEPGAGMLYGTKLQLVLGSEGMLPTWDSSNIFLIWILTVAACSPILFDDLRMQFAALLSESVRSIGYVTSQDYLAAINGFMWCDAAFGMSLHSLSRQIYGEI